jgi:hypothetical protein
MEIFGGYSVLSADGDDFPRRTSNGVLLDVAANVTPWFGIAGNLGVHFNTTSDLGPGFAGLTARTRVTQALVGPRFTGRLDRSAVFAHGLFGVARGDANDTFRGFGDSGLAFGGGAGVDLGLTPRLAVRAQFDLIAGFVDMMEGNSRFSVGAVVRVP